MLLVTQVLAELLPHEPEVLAIAATVRYAEARRPARLDDCGAMTPLAQQDPALWCRPLRGAAKSRKARNFIGRERLAV
jgi:RNA polymerase sigma-70 factor (ECF subfamily)